MFSCDLARRGLIGRGFDFGWVRGKALLELGGRWGLARRGHAAGVAAMFSSSGRMAFLAAFPSAFATLFSSLALCLDGRRLGGYRRSVTRVPV